MSKVARRVGIAFGAFVVAWILITVVGRWLFGSVNVLVLVLSSIVGAGVYLAILWRDRRHGQFGAGVDPQLRDLRQR
jgi:hypothetical protein